MALKSMKNIFVLTGAGISSESGISTFRDSNGLWENHKIEEVATPQGFKNNPELVFKFYNARRNQVRNALPNDSHFSLSKLEEKFSGKFNLITQNVDDLHERAGSKKLIHMHGELSKARCTSTQKIINWDGNFDQNTICPCCENRGFMRPHIVWFNEMPLKMDIIQSYLNQCDLFISIGTSGAIYPAATFVQMAKLHKPCHTIEVNVTQTEISNYFDDIRIGKASIEVPKLVEEILNSKDV